MNSLLNASVRKLHSKVEIVFAGNQTDNTIAITTNGATSFSQVSKAVDNKTNPTYPWFNLRKNKLDGSFKILPSIEQNEADIGVWSTGVTDTDGYLASPFIITVTHQVRPYSFIGVVGDITVDSFPKNFTVQFYNLSNQLVYTHTVVGNTNVSYLGTFTQINNITKIVLSVTRGNQSYDRIKILEFFASVIDTYTQTDRIQGMTLLEEMFPDNATLTLGQTSMNELDLVLSNYDDLFTPEQNIRADLLLKNRIIRPYIGAEQNGEITWFPLGQFYSVRWNLSEADNKSITVIARDCLELLRTTTYNTGTVQKNKTVYALFNTLFAAAGITNYTIDPSLVDIILPYSWFGNISILEALKNLCTMALIGVWVDKNNQIQVYQLSTLTHESSITFSNSTNIVTRQYPSGLEEPINKVTVIINEPLEKTGVNVYSSKDTITIPANSYTDINVVFNTDRVMSIDTITKSNVSVTAAMQNTFCYGGTLRITNPTGTQQQVTSLDLAGRVVDFSATRQVTQQDDIAINQNGIIQLDPIDKLFIQTSIQASNLATQLLEYYAYSSQDIILDTRGDISIEIGAAGIVEGNSNLYRIVRQQMEYDGGLNVRVTGKIL